MTLKGFSMGISRWSVRSDDNNNRGQGHERTVAKVVT